MVKIHTIEKIDSMYIAIYGRVSTEKQSIDGFGLDLQVEELINEPEKNGLEYRTYIDSGISGISIKKREGLKQLSEDVIKGTISELWVTRLSRLGRNTRDVLRSNNNLDTKRGIRKYVKKINAKKGFVRYLEVDLD